MDSKVATPIPRWKKEQLEIEEWLKATYNMEPKIASLFGEMHRLSSRMLYEARRKSGVIVRPIDRLFESE